MRTKLERQRCLRMKSRWPERLWIVRHGESAGNVARDLAHANNSARIDVTARDVDVPLSNRGEEQAEALGRWFAAMPLGGRPEIVLSSPYIRARGTADAIRRAGGLDEAAGRLVADERLREREFGILDRLTSAGIREFHPEQAELRRAIGKFYHRPPGGESWCDVILRLRSALDTISLHYPQRRVLIVAHQVVVLCLRYLLENLTEPELMAIDREGDVVNCGVTEYAFDASIVPDGALRLVRYNFAAPMERAGVPVTSAPDPPVAAR
jgi:probable phosphoglycerate mutase